MINRFRSRRQRQSKAQTFLQLSFERLDQRLVLSHTPIDPIDLPDPIDPKRGEQNLLDIINSAPLNEIQNALDNFPVPYVVVAQAGDNDPVVVNKKAGSPIQINVDDDKSTGKGGSGHDVRVEVNTELFPNPHLVLDIERLGREGADAFVEDVTVLVAFPFDAFNDETLPGSPNLVVGMRSVADDGSEGGIAPAHETISFVPGVLGGTSHDFQMTFQTAGADNPLEFLLGHFDGDISTGLLNGTGISALVDTPVDHSVPETIALSLDIDETALSATPLNTSFGLVWDATEPADVRFAYLEEETDVTQPPDFNTAVTVQSMPMHEDLSLTLSANPGFTLSHRGSDVIDALTFQHQRDDGLTIVGTATDIPTEVDLDVDLTLGDASVVLDVNDPTLDLVVEILQDGGFANTDAALGFDVGYLSVGVIDAVDLEAGYSTTGNIFRVEALNDGESIGAVEVVGDDDASFDLGGDLLGLNLPPSWADDPLHHIISFFDDGDHGTAAARLIHVKEAEFDFGTTDITEAYHLQTTQAAPLQAYLELEQGATILNNVPPEGIMITGDVDNVPAGTLDFLYEAPLTFGYLTDPPQGIDAVRFFGHIGTLNFDIGAGDLPPTFQFDFDPAGSMTVLAEDGFGGPDTVGHVTLRIWDELAPGGLPDTAGLLGVPLRDAIARVDEIPSFHATWTDDSTGTNIVFDTDALDVFVGGAQFLVSTNVESEFATPLPAANSSSRHFARFEDEGVGGSKRLGAGAFGIDRFSYSSNDAAATFNLNYDADLDRELEVIVDATFDGPFFPNYAVHAVNSLPTLFVDEVPQSFDLSLDLDPEFHYLASDPIDAVTIDAYVDETNDGSDNGSTIDIDLLGLPSRIDFVLNPATGATLDMSGPVDEISLHVESDVDIFGSGYQLIDATINDLPAKWEADWSGELRLEAKNQSDQPQPMGEVTALISRTNDPTANQASLDLFDTNGFQVNRSAFQQEIDDDYWPTNVDSSLLDLYGDPERLSPGEDHVVTRGGTDFVSVQFTGFQKVALVPTPGGGTFEFRAPSVGVHPLFVGMEESSEFTVVQFDNIPDGLLLTVDILNQFVELEFDDDVMSSIGQIDYFAGPANAGDGHSATRFVMNDTPDKVTLSWDFGILNGGVEFDASNVFELLFLDQKAEDSRLVAGARLEDVEIGYGVEILTFDTAETVDIPIVVPCEIPPTFLCPDVLEIPIAWDLLRATAGITASPGIDGFFGLYTFEDSPANLNSGQEPSGGEFVPQLTMMLNDFTAFNANAAVLLDPFLLGGTIPLIFPLSLEVGVTFDADLVFDFWDVEGTEESFTIPGVAMAFLTLGAETDDFDVGILNPPDYIDNSPIHLLPLDTLFGGIGFDHDWVITFDGFHDFGDHFDPFAP